MSVRVCRGFLAGLLCALLWTGCGQAPELVDETDVRAYRRGKSLLREGRMGEALTAFLEVIDERKVAPESHLEAGLIHLNHLGDPLSAIYHFNRYLQFQGEGVGAEKVRGLIQTGQKEYLRRLPGDPFSTQVQRMDLMDRFTEIQAENETLRTDLVGVRAELEQARRESGQLREQLERWRNEARSAGQEVAPIVVAPSPRPTTPGATVSAYTVQAGDTLSSISRTVYGSPGRWTDIYTANRDTLPSPNALRVGQVLRIP